jgi:hypothetical protein
MEGTVVRMVTVSVVKVSTLTMSLDNVRRFLTAIRLTTVQSATIVRRLMGKRNVFLSNVQLVKYVFRD